MEQRFGVVERKLEQLQAEFEQFRTEAKTERAALSNQIAAMSAQNVRMERDLTGLLQQRDEREKADLRRENELKSGEIAKLQAEIRQRTILSAIQKTEPILSLIIKGGAAALVIWAIFKYIVKSAN